MLNPVLIRDCRQMVRTRFVVIMIGLFLCGMLFAVYDVFLAEWNHISEKEQGFELYWRILLVTGIGTLITVLFSSIARIWSENTEPDPMFISLITPTQIVTGKLLGGVVVSTLFYCMALPFLSQAYLLRGVDLLEIGAALLGSFLLIQAIHAVCLAFFCGAKTLPRFIVMGIFFFPIGVIYALFASICGIAPWDAIRAQAAFLYAIFALISWALVFVPGVATLLAIAQYSPPSTNRMFWTRVFITVCGLLLLPMVIVEHYCHDQLGGSDTLPLVILLSFGGIVVMIFMNLIAICERDESSWRIRQQAPKRLTLRILKFPFSSGAVNAFCWVFLCTAFLVFATLTISFYSLPDTWTNQGLNKFLFGFAIFTLFVFNYSATAWMLHRQLLTRWIPRDWAWTLPLGLLVIVVCGTYFLGMLTSPELYRHAFFLDFFSENDTRFQRQILLAPNPLTVFVDWNGYRYVQIVCASFWFVVLGQIVFVWGVIRFTNEEKMKHADDADHH